MNEVGIVLGKRGGTVVITRRHKNIARNVEISFPLAKPLSCHVNLGVKIIKASINLCMGIKFIKGSCDD